MDLERLIESGDILLLIPFVMAVGWIVSVVLKHRERMAMIERGMNPDQAALDRKKPEQGKLDHGRQ
jgi:hypothetical protein